MKPDFHIVMPVMNSNAHVATITLSLLEKYWPDHPPVDVLHYEIRPIVHCFCRDVTQHYMGPQPGWLWSHTFLTFLERYNHSALMLLWNDFGLCAPLEQNAQHILHLRHLLKLHSNVACIHLSPQPVPAHRGVATVWDVRPQLSVLPPWDYSIDLQVALWNANHLENVLHSVPNLDPWQFEIQASRVWNQTNETNLICQATMPPPPGGLKDFADSMDKTHWVFPYHNLYRSGAPDPRHHAFLKAEGFASSC